MGVGAGWNTPHSPKAKIQKGLDIVNGFPGEAAFPTHQVSQQNLPMIKDGQNGRPQVYWSSCNNQAFINGNYKEAEEILKDENLLPFVVNSNIVYDETSQYADLLLPDVTYLERWDTEDMVSPAGVAEYYIRQPLIKPLGESKDQGEIFYGLAQRLGIELVYKTKEEFVR